MARFLARFGRPDTAGSEAAGEVESESLAGHLRESAKLFEQPLLGIIGALALVFGFIGYHEYLRKAGEPSGWVDVLYADMQLIKLSSKVVKGTDAPWTLNVGRMLAPIVTGYAAFRGVAALHRERLDRIRVQRWHGHVVVVGATSAAIAVAKALRRQNRRVVLIDNDLTTERATSLRSIGVFAMKGDPVRPEVLRQASIKGATDVLALTDDDAVNIDVALRSRGRARAMASVTRPDLCELLRIEALGATGSARLDFLNADEVGARSIDRCFRHGLVGGEGDLLIATPAVLASQLLARAARQATARVDVHVAGDQASQAVALAKRRDSSLTEHLAISVHSVVLDTERIGDSIDLSRITRAVVDGEGTEAVALALALARRLPDGAEIVLAIPDPEHLAPLLHSGAATRRVPIHIVDSISWWSDPDLVLGGTVEIIARATHANYVESRRASGADTTNDQALVEWAKLSKHLKESNRKQARHLWVKLAAVNCSLAPASGATSRFAFTESEVDLLAQLEHVRWVEERRADGWQPGPRDVAAKRTPYLVDWSELTEEIRHLDRITVTELPAFLSDVGYEIIRNEAAHPSHELPATLATTPTDPKP